MASGDNIVTIRDQRGRYLKGMPGGPGRPVGSRNKLSEDFLADLQADWEQHGKDILEVMRERHPEIYFQCMVKLALVHPVEAGGSNRRHTPEEIMAELEERVGPEGRQMFERFLRRVRRLKEQQLTMSPGAYKALKGHRRTPSPKPQSAERTGPERLHWRAKQTERATKHTYRWTPAHRSATKRATANPYGITLDRVWTDWAAQHGASETIAAALHLVSRDRKAQDVVVKLTPGEVERVMDIVQRWPDHFPPGTLAALEESRPTPPEPSAASRSPGVGSARPATLINPGFGQLRGPAASLRNPAPSSRAPPNTPPPRTSKKLEHVPDTPRNARRNRSKALGRRRVYEGGPQHPDDCRRNRHTGGLGAPGHARLREQKRSRKSLCSK
jgi:hypothetical protein